MADFHRERWHYEDLLKNTCRKRWNGWKAGSVAYPGSRPSYRFSEEPFLHFYGLPRDSS
jgi:hypothetical protein